MVIINEEVPSALDGVESSISQQQASSSVHHVEHIDKDSKMEKLKKNMDKNKRLRKREKQRKSTNPKIWCKSMDPQVWGNLPPNLTLEIYKKLPIRNFYQLREVCKDWNLVACEGRGIYHKPYFVLIHEAHVLHKRSDNDCYLHGILTFHIKSGSWQWTRLHAIPLRNTFLHQPFSVKGLTLTFHRSRSPESRQYYRVFDAHTMRRHNIPWPPRTSRKSSTLGMTVDTTVVPYTFKIIIGCLDIGTQVYDSVTKSWETRSSHLVPCNEPRYGIKTCLHSGNYMYIWVQKDKILTYSLEEDKWGTLDPPPRHASGLGSWQGRIFTTTCDGDEYTALLLWVWELVDQGKQTLWKKVDEMPGDMTRWLTPRLCIYDDIQIHARFSNEHVLIYSWVPDTTQAFGFVLYNVATKIWEKVEVPNHSVRL
ncbi:hypothetical protein M758_9G097000 [Ceratodon purpureus]|nr:hypothetical protein M758_9G097000 [Ceratodon purpureus]